MIQMKKIAAGVGTAFALGYCATAAAIPTPGAVADAYLILSNFTLLAGDNAAGKSFAPLPIGAGVTINSVATNSDTSATIGATTNSQSTSVGLGTAFSIQNIAGGAGFVANTTLPVGTMNPNTYAGSATSSFGNALIPLPQPGSICGVGNIGDCVPVHNQVNLANAGATGSAQANQNLITEFGISVTAGQRFELQFNAEGFLRAALGQPGKSANASYGWTATVRRVGTTTDILKWTPNGATPGNVAGVINNGLLFTEGSCVLAGNCAEYSDSFAMSNNVGLLSTGDVGVSTGLGTFEVELFLSTGDYTFTISHNTNADAELVPEPGTMSLLGLGLLGLGLGLRRRRAA